MELSGLAVTVLAAWFDLRTREIPDWITMPLILAGIFFSLAERGFLVAGGTILLGSALAELLYRFKVFGGGDLKLLLGLTLTGGPLYGLSIFYASLLAALPLFLFYMLKKRTMKPNIPYALAILAGLLIVCWRRWGI